MYRPPLRTLLLALAGLPFCAHGASAFAAPVSTIQMSAGVYQVTSTSQMTAGSGPALLAGGVNLLRVDGSSPAVLGVMHDDGLNGDAVAGDGIYTFVFTANSASVGQMVLQVAAAFRGTPERLKSPTGTVFIGTAVAQVVPNNGQQGQQGLSVAVTGQFTHFVQGTTTASFGAGITV